MHTESAISHDVLARYAADAARGIEGVSVTPAPVDVVVDAVSAPPPKR